MAIIKNPLIVAGGSRYNRTTNNPQKGDAVYLANGEVKFIKFDTLYTPEIPSTWVAVGVVQEAKDANGDVMICEKSNASYKVADVFRFKVTPQASYLDGASHTVAVKLHDTVQPDFTFTASSVQEYATALNTYLRTSVTSHTYWAYYDTDASCIYMFLGNYTAYEGGTNTIAGANVEKWIYSEITAYSSLKSKQATKHSGEPRSNYWQVINKERIFEYVKNNASASYNPSTFSYTQENPVSFTCWMSSVCDEPRALYGATEQGWKDYILDNYTCDLDAANTATANENDPLTGHSRRSGYWNMQALANTTYKDINGVVRYLYPAIRYAMDCNYDCDGLRSGSWFIPSLYEGFKVDNDITYGLAGVTRANADIVNRCLNAIGGSAVSCTSLHWFASRYFTGSAWLYSGYGCSDAYLFGSAFLVRRFTLYHIGTN